MDLYRASGTPRLGYRSTMAGSVPTLWNQLDIRSKGSLARLRGLLVAHTGHLAAGARQSAGNHRSKIEGLGWLAVAAGAIFAVPSLQSLIAPLLGSEGLATLRDMIVAASGAMIGATAIVASFILFAMQVNVERLPYGLFHRFSSDARLLGGFAAAFMLSLGTMALAFIEDPGHSSAVVVAAIFAVALILRLLLHAYRRSLRLIDPVSQLAMIEAVAAANLRRWDRRVRWLQPLLAEDPGPGEPAQRREGVRLDVSRAVILEANKGWDAPLRTAIRQAAAFSRQAAERGDLDVSAAALDSLLALNRAYVAVKGRSFYARNLLVENPQVTDGTINTTLEELRRLRVAALAGLDELHLEQLFQTHLGLVRIYLGIEYPGLKPSPSHALLAANYLESAVEAVVPTQMTDTLMEGVKCLGDAARLFASADHASAASSFFGKIAKIGVAGAMQRDGFPVTVVVIEQLAALQLSFFYGDGANHDYATRQLRSAIFTSATAMFALPDLPLGSKQTTALAPFFSGSDPRGFRSSLTSLVNALHEPGADAAMAAKVAHNIADWADKLYVEVRALLKLAIEKRSQFVIDLIHWITGMSELLFFAAQAPATAHHDRSTLEKQAHFLIGSLTFIPRDPETAKCIEAFSLIDILFEFGSMAQDRDWPEGFNTAFDALLRWGFEAGAENNGWNTLDSALAAVAALTIGGDAALRTRVIAAVQTTVAAEGAPAVHVRERAARSLRDRADHLHSSEFDTDAVNLALCANIPAARALLAEIAELLAPAPPLPPIPPAPPPPAG